jgi:hypothetical protein
MVETAKSKLRRTHKREGGEGGGGLNPNAVTPIYPGALVGLGRSGQQGHGQATTHSWAVEAVGRLQNLIRPVKSWAGPSWADTRKA